MEVVTIKKYKNRRLYHTEEKRYITLDYVIKMIRSGEKIKVIDSQSDKDITQKVLWLVFAHDYQTIFSPHSLHILCRLSKEQKKELVEFINNHIFNAEQSP